MSDGGLRDPRRLHSIDTMASRSYRFADLRTRAGAYLVPRVRALRYWTLYRRFLRESGWDASARTQAPVDPRGRPLPWYTYGAIAFLDERVTPDMRVFEYGSGSSTRWWAARAGKVVAVEDDAAWFHRVGETLPENVDLRFAAGTEYVRAPAQDAGPFDVVVIDGSDRNRCAEYAVPALKDDGVVVWDNADWTEMFQDGMDTLQDAGFRRIGFRGLGPLNGYGWMTSVFYRRNNCLGI